MRSSGVITFISDFGLEDWFVAAVKGEILKINRKATIVDITHTIKPHDIRSAAFVLLCAYNNFPDGTVHIVVVDPGVGGPRRAIIMESDRHFFVAPDNGVLSYVVRTGARFSEIPVSEDASSTFHGRDVFAPVAARLSMGRVDQYRAIGADQCVRIEFPGCEVRKNDIKGEVMYIDHFGNCITNIPVIHPVRSLMCEGAAIPVVANYTQGNGSSELIAVKGSAGFYEISAYQGRASEVARIDPGAAITALLQAP